MVSLLGTGMDLMMMKMIVNEIVEGHSLLCVDLN